MWPGLGHIYARAWQTGAILLAISFALGLGLRCATFVLPPDIPEIILALAVLAAAILLRLGAAVHVARLLCRPRPAGHVYWFCSTWFAAIVLIVLDVGTSAAGVGWQSFSIPSSANLPTLTGCDYVLTDSRRWRPPLARGDMVVFRLPISPDIFYVKRVVALGGDQVRLRGGDLLVNGEIMRLDAAGTVTDITESGVLTLKRYVETLPDGRHYTIAQLSAAASVETTPEFTVPAGHMFVLGDNRDNSVDSRFMDRVGYVSVRNVVGRVARVTWSCDRSRILQTVE